MLLKTLLCRGNFRWIATAEKQQFGIAAERLTQIFHQLHDGGILGEQVAEAGQFHGQFTAISGAGILPQAVERGVGPVKQTSEQPEGFQALAQFLGVDGLFDEVDGAQL